MLDTLPLEILRLIGERLDQVSPESVIDLACANKHCFSVIATILYRTLKFPISDSAQLTEDVHHYSRLLRLSDGYGSVRRIIVESRNPGEVFKRTKERARTKQWTRPRLSGTESRGHGHEIIENYMIMDYREDSNSLVPLKEVHRTNHLWNPLAEFIRQIPSLESLFYESYSQFPHCLLNTIHQHQPQCKLYLTNFHLLSLNARGTADEHEFAISPWNWD